MFLLQLLPHCRPTAYEGWLPDRGLEPFDAQDRVFRDARPVDPGSVPSSVCELAVERVDLQTADEWAEYLQRIYGLDTGPWLPRLIGRPGWHQYVVREEGRIVGARGMYIGPDGMAWLGMNAPVPGVMAQDYQPDAAICAFLVEDGLANGARVFLADIEAPSASMDAPAYQYFSRLGFSRPYARTGRSEVSLRPESGAPPTWLQLECYSGVGEAGRRPMWSGRRTACFERSPTPKPSPEPSPEMSKKGPFERNGARRIVPERADRIDATATHNPSDGGSNPPRPIRASVHGLSSSPRLNPALLRGDCRRHGSGLARAGDTWSANRSPLPLEAVR